MIHTLKQLASAALCGGLLLGTTATRAPAQGFQVGPPGVAFPLGITGGLGTIQAGPGFGFRPGGPLGAGIRAAGAIRGGRNPYEYLLGQQQLQNEMLDEAAVSRIAETLARAQVRRIQAAVQRVLEKHPSIRVAVVTGLGAFLGASAVQGTGLGVVPLSTRLGDAGTRCAPAVSVALLLEGELAGPAAG